MNKWLNSTVTAYLRYFGKAFEPIVYEVGSRDGIDGIELAERIVDGHLSPEQHKNVVLLECNPPQAEIIRKAYPRATVLEVAASDKDGEADFLAIDGLSNIAATGSSSLDLNREKIRPGRKKVIKVQTRRLAPILDELHHSSIDIMKIDAEGFSWEVLQGLGRRLANIKVLHIETEMEGHYVTGKTNKDIFAFMADQGFLCAALEYEWGGVEDQVWVNAELFANARRDT